MLILIRKIMKIQNYVRNEFTIELLKQKLLSMIERIFNI